MPKNRETNSSSTTDQGLSPGLFLASCAVSKAARTCHSLHRPGPTITGFIVPKDAEIKLYQRAIELIAFRHSKTDRFGNSDTAIVLIPDDPVKRRREPPFDEVVHDYERIVVVAERRETLPESFNLVADAVVEIAAIEPRHVKAAAKVCLNREITDKQAEFVASKTLETISLIFRKGCNVDAVVEKLAQHTDQPAKNATTGPMLQDLYGLGDAGNWGRELSIDLADWQAGRIAWSDVDRGILLSGQAGTGKTTFAKALANSCGAHLVLGSIARWQAMGHLGDMLKAMRKAFDKARQNVPAILFLDEIDAVGSRQEFSGDNAHYANQVVAALLECIDGVEGREGVVIVGACNYPELLDSALVRAGRLDRHIRIPYPDATARQGILRFHLQEKLKDTDLTGIVERTSGKTGADLEQIVRAARRRARRERRQLELSDLRKSLPLQLPIPAPVIRRSAVHEAGHAIVGLELGFALAGLSVADVFDADGSLSLSAGGATFHIEVLTERIRSQFMDSICLSLAGLAAEELAFGQRGAGGGGEPGSDLYRATVEAISVEATYGLGSELAYLSSASEEELFTAQQFNSDLRKRVNKTLQDEYHRATRILSAKHNQLNLLARELFEKRDLAPDAVQEIVSDQLRLELEPTTSGNRL